MGQSDSGDAQVHCAKAKFGSLELGGTRCGGIVELDQWDLAIVEDVLSQV